MTTSAVNVFLWMLAGSRCLCVWKNSWLNYILQCCFRKVRILQVVHAGWTVLYCTDLYVIALDLLILARKFNVTTKIYSVQPADFEKVTDCMQMLSFAFTAAWGSQQHEAWHCRLGDSYCRRGTWHCRLGDSCCCHWCMPCM